MTGIAELEPLELEGLRVVPDGRHVQFEGVASMRSPGDTLSPYLRQVHEAAAQSDRLDELVVNVKDLRFMNSSSIRVLVDWLEWIRAEPQERQYVLHFKSNPESQWQRTTLSAIQALGSSHVTVSTG